MCLVAALTMGHALLPAWAASAAPASTPPMLVAPIPRSVWLYEPDPAALPSVHSRLDEVLDLVDPVNRQVMADSEVRIHVIPQDWNLTDLPPWSNLRGQRLPDPNPYDGYNENRTYDQLRGLGPAACVDGPLEIAISEEQLVSLPRGRYPSPADLDVGKILVHEVGHGVECSLSPEQSGTLDDVYAAASARFPDAVVGDTPFYSVSTRREYFAEGVVAWFEAAKGPTYRRAWLRDNDRALHDLLAEVFAVPPEVPLCDGKRATLIARPGGSGLTGTPGDDIIVGTPDADVINGGGGADLICGEDGNDTLRGGYGADKVYGGPGDDTLNGGAGDDLLSGDAGTDDCTGDGDDRILSCNEPDPPAPTTTSTVAARPVATVRPAATTTTTAATAAPAVLARPGTSASTTTSTTVARPAPTTTRPTPVVAPATPGAGAGPGPAG